MALFMMDMCSASLHMGNLFDMIILMSAHGTKQCSWTAASEAVLPNLELQGDEGQETQKQYYT